MIEKYNYNIILHFNAKGLNGKKMNHSAAKEWLSDAFDYARMSLNYDLKMEFYYGIARTPNEFMNSLNYALSVLFRYPADATEKFYSGDIPVSTIKLKWPFFF